MNHNPNVPHAGDWQSLANYKFNVQPEGTVLSRTSVAINGKKGALTDIPTGKTVIVYWTPDAKDPTARFAKKIDVILSEQELDEKYGKGEE